jgi:SAM-dependent methyltransferase
LANPASGSKVRRMAADPSQYQSRVIKALQDVSADPEAETAQIAFFRLMNEMVTELPTTVLRPVVAKWLDICADGDQEIAINRLHWMAKDSEFIKNVSSLMTATGFSTAALRAFSYSCRRLDDPSPSTKTDDRVRESFVQRAVGYDRNAWHVLTARQFERFLEESVPFEPTMAAMDVGCGTGLVGEWLKPRIGHLDGVDFSQPMLDQAQARGVYDDLILGDGMAELGRRPARYDLVFCNFCLHYTADLNDFFRAAAGALKAGGGLALTVYACWDDAEIMRKEDDSQIEYAHSRPYLRHLADSHGLNSQRIEFRALCAHPGYFCYFSKGL